MNARRGRYRSGALVAVTLLLAAAAPGAGRPPESALGVHVALEPASLDLAVGDRAVFTVRLWFDPPPGGATSMLLDLSNGAWQFAFTSAGTDTTRLRDPYRPAGPAEIPDDVVTINSDWSWSGDMIVPLLAPDGEQIPPGQYTVRAVYRNISPAVAPQASPDTELEVWTGALSSAGVEVTVHPATRPPIPVDVPTGVVFNAAAEGNETTGWGWAQPARPVAVTPRPGYAVAVHWEMSVHDRHGAVVSESSGDNTTGKWPAAVGLLWPDLSARVDAEEPFSYTVKVEVFETSILPGHLWNPRKGDYRVLWHRTLEGTVP